MCGVCKIGITFARLNSFSLFCFREIEDTWVKGIARYWSFFRVIFQNLILKSDFAGLYILGIGILQRFGVR